MANQNRIEHRIIYADTDHGGAVYYNRYLEWMEKGRTEILRDNGITYADFEKKRIIAPVAHVEVDYRNSPKYDEIIVIETKIEKIGNSSIEFIYKVYKKSDNTLIATAKTVNVFITKAGEKVRVPDGVRKILG